MKTKTDNGIKVETKYSDKKNFDYFFNFLFGIESQMFC